MNHDRLTISWSAFIPMGEAGDVTNYVYDPVLEDWQFIREYTGLTGEPGGFIHVDSDPDGQVSESYEVDFGYLRDSYDIWIHVAGNTGYDDDGGSLVIPGG